MRRVVFALFLVLSTASAFAQKELTIDLKDTGIITVPVARGDYTVRIIDKVIGKQYDVTADIRPILEAPVSIAEAKKPPAAPAAPSSTAQAAIGQLRTIANSSSPNCTTVLDEAKKAFKAATTAEERRDAILAAREAAKQSGCPDVSKYADEQCADLLKTAQTAIAAADTEAKMALATAPLRVLAKACPDIQAYLDLIDETLGPFTLGESQMLVVTIIRKDNSATWVRNFSTGKRGDWLASYGILLVPNRDANYSSYSLGNDVYEVRRSRDREKFDYIPTLAFTFMRPHDAPRDWFDSPIFGIGYDLQTISATAGWALTYNHNFSISAGVMLHQQRRLKGKYEEGEHYTKTGNVLENSDLTEMTWAPNVYVGITIRSLTNPFAR